MTLDIFTEQDVELIKLCIAGHSSKSLATYTGWTPLVVRSRLKLLYQLAEVKNKTELVRKYRQEFKFDS